MRRRVHGPDQFAFNEWHRPNSLGRFIDHNNARKLYAFDLDMFEYCYKTRKCLLIHNLKLVNPDAMGNLAPNENINLDVDLALAQQMNCTLWSTQYALSEKPNPGNRDYPDCSWFFVKRIWPEPEMKYISMSPQAYAEYLNATIEYLRSK